MNDEKTKWATLVYLAGDNSLSEEMVWNLQEMKKTIEADKNEAFSGKRVKVIAQYDARGANPRTYNLTEGASPHSSGLTEPGEPEADGNLADVGGDEYTAKEILDCVQKRIEPNAEHWARATFHEEGLSDQDLYKTLTTGTLAKDRCDLSENEAVGFLVEMLLLSDKQRRDYTRDDIDDLTIKGAEALPRILKRIIDDSNGTSQNVQNKKAEQIIDKHKELLAQQLKREDLDVAETEAQAKLLCDDKFSSFDPPYLGLRGENLPIPKWQAVCFVLHLLLYSKSEREELMDGDRTGLNEKGNKRLSELLTLIIQNGSKATETERAESIINEVRGFIVDQLKKTPVFSDTSRDGRTLNLSELISRSSESLSKHMSGLTSAYMAEEFIEKQAKLVGEVDHHLVVLSGHGSGLTGQ
ncbi:MAG TPA: hypothetical protein VMY18_11310 [Acidobacteriota bacterium]|nr:hypothetical protein [Acidobacteriota bacterium]